MEIIETNADGLRREFKIVVPAARIEEQLEQKLKELGRQVRLPGFRPGKVPVGLLRKRFGSSVRGEILEETVNESTKQTMTDRGIRPAGEPRIEVTRFDEGSDLEYTLAVETLPEIEPIDFSGLQLERLRAETPEEEITKSLDRLAELRQRFQPPAEPRPAKPGDQVVIDFAGEIDGEAGPGMSGEDREVVLGSGTLFDGFEDQLVGAEAGTQRSVGVTLPEDYEREDLRGRSAVFEVTVKEVREPVPTAIDDELGKEFGFEGLDPLKEALRQQTQIEYDKASRARLKRALLDRLAENHSFAVPPSMVEAEFEGVWHQVEARRKHQQEHARGEHADHDHEHHHDPELDKPEEELRGEYREIAERRVRLGLLLAEVGRRNHVDVSQGELTQAMLAEARRYPGQERTVLEFFQKNPKAAEQLRAPLYEDKVIDLILELAQVTERTVPPEELMRDPEEDGAGVASAGEPEDSAPAADAAAAPDRALADGGPTGPEDGTASARGKAPEPDTKAS